MLEELGDTNWDVVMFSKTRCANINATLDGGYRFVTSTQPTHAAGVAILLHQRHSANIKATHSASDTLLFADVSTDRGMACFIAAYVPHGGYSQEDLDDFYGLFHFTLDDANKKCYLIIIGCDFNTQLGIGVRRSDMLTEIATSFGLVIANDDEHHDKNAETWTFESSLGARRRIDYVLFSSKLILDTAFATDILDMGSDHRAVYSRVHLGRRVPLNRRKRNIQRGWKPVLNEKGQPDNYHQALHEVLCCSQPRSMPELEDVLAKAAHKTQVQNNKNACDVPWNCDGFKQLLLRRK